MSKGGFGSEGGFCTDVWLAEMTTSWEVSGPPNTRFSSIHLVTETGSTNKDLLDAARDGVAEGAVLVTDHQTAGRGRQGREWIDEPESSLLCSLLLRPDTRWAPLIPLVTGVALVRAVRSEAELNADTSVGLKWPNDVLVSSGSGREERKLAGILAEAATHPETGFVVVVGFGMNLRWTKPPTSDVEAKAIDLASVGTRSVDRISLLNVVLSELEQLLVLLEQGKSDVVLETYRHECLTIGRKVRFQTGPVSDPGEVFGQAVGVDTGGALLVAQADGSTEILTAGDAHHLA